jgi:hypothetical protein
MTDTQREYRAADDSTAPQADDAREQESAVLPVARLLANPRRIRRD